MDRQTLVDNETALIDAYRATEELLKDARLPRLRDDANLWGTIRVNASVLHQRLDELLKLI